MILYYKVFQERQSGQLLTEFRTLSKGRALLITGGQEEGSVHIHIGELGTTYPRSWVEYLGEDDFHRGLVKTSQRLVSTLQEIGII